MIILLFKKASKIKMSLQKFSCEDHYKTDKMLNRNEVLKLQQWQQTQPHLPNITG